MWRPTGVPPPERARVSEPPFDARAAGPLLTQRVDAALRARAPTWNPQNTIMRLVHDAADGLPGLQVDRMGPLAVVQAYHPAWEARLPAVAHALLQADASLTTVRAMVRAPGGQRLGEEVREGAALADEYTAFELGCAFRIRPADESLNVGIFPDARVARQRVRQWAQGHAVLNLFAYAGGFTVAAMVGGATTVDHVDTNPKMAPWGARNVEANGLNPKLCRFVVDDAAHFLARLVRQGRRYGLVVVDPPTFGRSQRGTHNNQALADLCGNALRVCQPGGRVMVANNTRQLAAPQLWEVVAQSAQGAGVPVQWEGTVEAGDDYPRHTQHAALDRFKMVVARVGTPS